MASSNSNVERSLGLKVFSATKAREREFLGETVTDWMRTHPTLEIFDKIVTQSSDREFHCLVITLFYRFDARRGCNPGTWVTPGAGRGG